MTGYASLVGKRVGGCLYVHRNALDLIDEQVVAAARDFEQLVSELPWNVAKVSGEQISFLVYENFDQAAFPALLKSATINTANRTVTIRDYTQRDSPPILHRKETLLRPDDPRIPRFSALTRAAEAHGLFGNTKIIGTKRRWEELLRAAKVRIVGHDLVCDGERSVKVERHRTAITRYDLSQPIALMLQLGMIEKEGSVFDYGCGQGDDVVALRANGFEVFGWDPHYAPDGPRRKADAVNLGFVLNVIENPHERYETVKDAWSFAQRVLTVAVMPQGKGVSRHTLYKDGFLTSRGTFQRYFSQDDLRDIVLSATGETPISLTRGIVSVFRDKDLEQEVSYRRRSRASVFIDRFVAPERPSRRVGRRLAPSIRERITAELEALWRVALSLGRLPDPSEVPAGVAQSLSEARVSPERAVAMCADGMFDASLLKEAAEARRDDLLVHFALTLFPGATKYVSLPRSIQRDVRTFFGRHGAAMDQARGLLFSVGKPETVFHAIEQASAAGLGGMRGKTFRFQTTCLPRMPSAIRVVVGCAEVIEPDLSSYDFIDIDPAHGQVHAIRCDDTSRSIPLVSEIVTADLKALRRKRSKPKGVMLYLKARYMPFDDPARRAQQQIDTKLLKAGLVSDDGEGPSDVELARTLKGGT